MKVNQKAVRFRIEPYIQETAVQAAIDILVLAIVVLVFAIAKFPLIAYVAVIMGYLIMALIFHYRVTILAVIDECKSDYITETVRIKSYNEEYSFSGDRLGHSYIRFFYPKEMGVMKHKIQVVNNLGEEKKLRSVMSTRRRIQFADLERQQVEQLQVTYLRRSKILVGIDLKEQVNGTNSKRKDVIEKAVRCINYSV